MKQTDEQKDKETATLKKTDGKKRQGDKDSKTDKPRDKETETVKRTDGQTGRHTDRQLGSQIQ